MSDVRVLYVGGCGRSGSTLLDRILGQLPGFCSVGELVHIWQRGLVDNQLCGCGAAFKDCPFWMEVGHRAYGGWDAIDVQEVLALKRAVDRNRFIPLMVATKLSRRYLRSLRAYSDHLSRLYRGIGEASGSRVVVDSSKHASSGFLLRHVPGVDPRLVHLVRDSRGVAFSWTKRVPKPEVVHQGAFMPTYHPLPMGIRWDAYNALFHLLASLGVPATFIWYDNLIRSPRREVERILELAGERLAERDLAFIGDGYVELGPNHTVAGNPMRLDRGRLALTVDEEWRRKMKRHHQAAVTAVTAPLLLYYRSAAGEDGAASSGEPRRRHAEGSVRG